MRSATSYYIPGFLPTYLNVGINETVFEVLKNIYGIVIAGKIYINNLQTIYRALFPYKSGDEICSPITPYFSISEIEKKINILKEEIKHKEKDILTDTFQQTLFFAHKTNEFFLKNQDLIYTLKKGDISYPSIILQKMVWTIRNDDCYPGVLYSRHSRTGLGRQIESVRNMFGDDIMTGNIERTDIEFFNNEEIKKYLSCRLPFCSLFTYRPMKAVRATSKNVGVILQLAGNMRGMDILYQIASFCQTVGSLR